MIWRPHSACLHRTTPATRIGPPRPSSADCSALRFASDEELPLLLERASRERLAPSDIKRAVRAWVADHERT
ncbi:MAG TPA: DUF6526 family protein [Vicinamibacterales bacterium]|nr:DUF6526 family protein [Vicinamibacterales bacterium]